MNTTLKESLTSYAGPLSPAELQTLRDMQGWIEYCISSGFTLQSTLRTLAHDVNGVLADVSFLRPKVAGYARYRTELEDLSDMASDPNPNDD